MAARRILVAPLLAAALALAAACGAAPGGADASGVDVLKVPIGGSPQRGPADAWVTLVEFADFECPFCRAEAPVVDEVAAAYGSDLRVVFKHLPLEAIHPDARRAALAVECAHDQGRFWELHDLLFRGALDAPSVAAAAQQVAGLDAAAWQTCLDAAAPAARVDADLALAAGLGVRATPTFAVNGTRIVGAVPASALRAAIDRARDAAIASGIPRSEYYDRAVLGLP